MGYLCTWAKKIAINNHLFYSETPGKNDVISVELHIFYAILTRSLSNLIYEKKMSEYSQYAICMNIFVATWMKMLIYDVSWWLTKSSWWLVFNDEVFIYVRYVYIVCSDIYFSFQLNRSNNNILFPSRLFTSTNVASYTLLKYYCHNNDYQNQKSYILDAELKHWKLFIFFVRIFSFLYYLLLHHYQYYYISVHETHSVWSSCIF